MPQGPEPGPTGRWELVFFHSSQPLVALFFPSEEGRIVASRLAEGRRAAWARGSPWVAWSRPGQGQTLILHQMGDSLIGLSSLKGSFSPKIGIFYREIKKKKILGPLFVILLAISLVPGRSHLYL